MTEPPAHRDADTPGDSARPLAEHLGEARRRLLWCLGAAAVLSLLGWRLTPLFLDHVARSAGPLIYLAPTEAFLVRLKMALALGALLSVPFFLYHLWRFFGVALTIGERRVVGGALPASFALFAGGVALGWAVVVPAGLRFLLGFGGPGLRPTLSVAAVFDFALWTCLGLGLLFQLPVVVGALAAWGFVRSDTLRRHRRHAVVVIFVLAAVLTPGPDVFSQLLLAVPTYLLFEIAVGVARWIEP